MLQPLGEAPAIDSGDFITLRYTCGSHGWTITPVESSPALEDLYAGPVYLMHGDVLMFTARGPSVDEAWTTRIEANERKTAELRAQLAASDAALEASQDKVQQLKDALARMATGQ